MKFPYLRLLLVFTLAVAQLGAMAHALSHLQQRTRDKPPAGYQHVHHCVVCDAYNVFDHGATAPAAIAPSARFHAAPSFFPHDAIVLAGPFDFRIRAPPA